MFMTVDLEFRRFWQTDRQTDAEQTGKSKSTQGESETSLISVDNWIIIIYSV